MNIKNKEKKNTPSKIEIDNLSDQYKNKNFLVAEKLAIDMTKKFPNFLFGWKALGLTLIKNGKFSEAIIIYKKIIDRLPNDHDSYYNLANCLREQGDLTNAESYYKRAISINPNYSLALNNLGLTLQMQNKLREAIDYFNKSIELDPKNYMAINNLGHVSLEQGDLNKAETCFKKAILLNPKYSLAFCNLGLALLKKKKLDSAEKYFRKALDLKHDLPEAWLNLGNLLDEKNQLYDSENCFKKAISFKKNYTDALVGLALVLHQQGKINESEKIYKNLISTNNKNESAKFNLSLIYNLKGNFENGFKLYESRFQLKEHSTIQPRKKFTWDGDTSIKGKKFLIYEEQGLGDIIQFCRYLPLLEQKGGNVIFKVKSEMHHLLNTLDCKIHLTDNFNIENHIDFEAPLMSLPYLFNTKLSSIPSKLSYLKADPKKIIQWNKKLKSNNLKIGICWQGSNKKIDKGRSFSLEFFKDISKIPNIELISLYKGEDEKKLFEIDFKITSFGNSFDCEKDAFIDTAAIMMNCDLIITSDTAIAHLAGALGRPVWVALKYIPDWRWMLKRSDTPWYPSMRLYRQTKINDWNNVFNQIKINLNNFKKDSFNI
jgi:tetratricopeptide (TPR) repeat protein